MDWNPAELTGTSTWDLDLEKNNIRKYCIKWELNPKPSSQPADDIPDQLTIAPDSFFQPTELNVLYTPFLSINLSISTIMSLYSGSDRDQKSNKPKIYIYQMKKAWIASFRAHVWPWELCPKTSDYKPFFQNLKLTKIMLISASIHKKNAKYLTKCEFMHILILFEYIISHDFIH